MRKGTGLVNKPIDEIYDKLLPHIECDPLVFQVIGNTINAIISAFNTNYNTAWQIAKRLEHEFDLNLMDGRELIQNYPYYWSKEYFHSENRRIYESIHSMEIFAFNHGIKLTKKHCNDRIKYLLNTTANLPRFNNNLYFFLTGDLPIEHFIQNPKNNQTEFSITYMEHFLVPTEYDVPFFIKNKAYYKATGGNFRWNTPKFRDVKPTCNNALAWLFDE